MLGIDELASKAFGYAMFVRRRGGLGPSATAADRVQAGRGIVGITDLLLLVQPPSVY